MDFVKNTILDSVGITSYFSLDTLSVVLKPEIGANCTVLDSVEGCSPSEWAALLPFLQEPVLSPRNPAFQYSSHVSLQSPGGYMW